MLACASPLDKPTYPTPLIKFQSAAHHRAPDNNKCVRHLNIFDIIRLTSCS